MQHRSKSSHSTQFEEHAATACPACELCAEETRLVGLESVPHSDQADLCTYECGTCGHLQARVVIRRDARGKLIDFVEEIASDTAGQQVPGASTVRVLNPTERVLAAIVESSEDAIVSVDLNGIIGTWNQGAERLFGYTAEEMIGQSLSATLIPADRREEEIRNLEWIARGERILPYRTIRRRKDGELVHVALSLSPVKNPEGAIIGAAKIVRDMTELQRAEQAHRDIETRFQLLADNIPILCWMARGDGWLFWYNRRWYEYTGATPESQQGWGWEAVHDPEMLAAVKQQWKASIDTGEPFEMSFPLRGADGVFRDFLTRAVPLRDDTGRVIYWFGTNTDITHEHEAAERARLLARELAHRGKNTLAVMQSLVVRSLSEPRSLPEARQVLLNRLAALARSQTLIVNSGAQRASLGELARLEFEGFSDRVTAVGPDVALNPPTAQTLALVVHELATNAAKYGALAQPGGSIEIRWSISSGSDAKLTFRWQERDGPQVALPTREGFGRTLIEKVVAQQFGTQPAIEFRPDGLVYEFSMPLSLIEGETLDQIV